MKCITILFVLLSGSLLGQTIVNLVTDRILIEVEHVDIQMFLIDFTGNERTQPISGRVTSSNYTQGATKDISKQDFLNLMKELKVDVVSLGIHNVNTDLYEIKAMDIGKYKNLEGSISSYRNLRLNIKAFGIKDEIQRRVELSKSLLEKSRNKAEAIALSMGRALGEVVNVSILADYTSSMQQLRETFDFEGQSLLFNMEVTWSTK